MKLLLDTNAYTALFRGHETVAAHLRRASQMVVSTVVAGELLFGFRNGTRYEANRKELEDFLDSPYVVLLPVTLVTADRFGRIAAALRRKGTPLPTNDIWIAAHAMESGAVFLRSTLRSCGRNRVDPTGRVHVSDSSSYAFRSRNDAEPSVDAKKDSRNAQTGQ